MKSVSGQKICGACRDRVHKHPHFKNKNDKEMDSDSDSNHSISNLQSSIAKEETLEKINTSLVELGESPLKLHSISSHSKPTYAKRKVESAYSTLKSKVSRVMGTELSPSVDKKKTANRYRTKSE